jgi:hypothetical protein
MPEFWWLWWILGGFTLALLGLLVTYICYYLDTKHIDMDDVIGWGFCGFIFLFLSAGVGRILWWIWSKLF